ncbi:NupC/NupG family nucleoside CNT transporter [Hanstruepera flava]|uniref:NupC/NupG family nucleoside CNT transporter n=1 Tax=Hanstruepera flava TaxID=2930218 RepID=UPI002028D700|nr:nucleoside transporter C-terminal domain-containing protein [Hanstruepera flava]
MKHFLLAFTAIFFGITISNAQSIEKKWQFQSVENDSISNLFELSKSDVFILNKGDFKYNIESRNLEASGDYIHQNNLLVFYYNQPNDTIRRYKITELTDSTLVFNENNTRYSFKSVREIVKDESTILTNSDQDTIIPSQGFSFNSLWRGILGMVCLIFIAFLFSSNRRAVNWKTVGIGLVFQLLIAIGVLKVPFVQAIFKYLGKAFNKVLTFTEAGTEFLFSSFISNEIESPLINFAITILPTIIFFSALTSVLFYLGIIQKIVKAMGWLLTKLLGISGAESLSVAGNIFLGQTEAPLMIKAYLQKMNKSEMLLVMIGGMATVAGGVLAAYIQFLGGDDMILREYFAKHLLAASVMAAPGAIVISKILYPQTEEINTDVTISKQKIGSNILDSIAIGTTEGFKLAVNVAAMLLVFVAFIALINYGLTKLGTIGNINEWVSINSPYPALSLEAILGTIFAPLMWLIGVATDDIMMMGQLLGIKLAASEFVGYIQLGELKNIANTTHLNYEKSIIMATYMLCGFANFASIGIQIGGIGSLAPGQRKTLSEFGMKALIGGTIASLISATIAGMIIG